MSIPKELLTGPNRGVRHYPPDVYRGENGEASAWLRESSTPPDLTMKGGQTCEFIATSADTNGLFGLYRWTFGKEETGAATHFHRSITEQFYVLSGEVQLFDGKAWRTGRPGDFFYVPEGGVHGFRGADFAQMLVMFAPGGPREAYFENSAGSGWPTDPIERQRYMIEHDNYLIE